MRRFILAAILLALPLISRAQDAQGYISYSLPRTVLMFDVSAQKEVFHAGPYAKYAQKYLGITVREQDQTSYRITKVSLNPLCEADQTARFSIALDNSTMPVYLQMTNLGLISGKEGSQTRAAGWDFPASDSKVDFSGIPANLTSEANTLYTKGGTVQQNMIVEKTPEKKAQEVAEMIFRIRDNRYRILVGDTDATYSGEAMKATIDELNRMEKEYLTLFTGYSEYQSQSATFQVVPNADNEKQIYVAFRLSDSEGLVAADNMAGKPYIVELIAEPVAPVQDADRKAKKPDQEVKYRIPAICEARLSDGANTILQHRVAVYQLGEQTTYPIYKQK